MDAGIEARPYWERLSDAFDRVQFAIQDLTEVGTLESAREALAAAQALCGALEAYPGTETGDEQAMTGCCDSPHLIWTPYAGLPEPIITCSNCGFRLDPDGRLLDWLDPDAILMDQILEERTPRILELAARLGLFDQTEGGTDDAND